MNCVTINFKTAPVQVRAQFAFSEEERKQFIHWIKSTKITEECVVLSTCNRSEIYTTGPVGNISKVQQALATFKEVPLELCLTHSNVYCGRKAIKHLYKVACGLDSMVLGEDEILGQLKDAFFLAREQDGTGYELNMIFQEAITCAKRIKTDTNLSKIPVSIGTLVANEVFQFEKERIKNVLIIGISGKMGSIVMKNIRDHSEVKVFGTVRNHNKEVVVFEHQITVIDYEKRYEAMDMADVIISVTSSPHYTITKRALEEAIVTKKKRLFIDLSVPMDMDKEIAKLENVTLYDIDYFEKLSAKNNTSKLKEVSHAEEILETFIEDIQKTLEFHAFLEEMPRVKSIFEGKSFESIMYQLRDQTCSEEFHIFMKVLRDL